MLNTGKLTLLCYCLRILHWWKPLAVSSAWMLRSRTLDSAPLQQGVKVFPFAHFCTFRKCTFIDIKNLLHCKNCFCRSCLAYCMVKHRKQQPSETSILLVHSSAYGKCVSWFLNRNCKFILLACYQQTKHFAWKMVVVLKKNKKKNNGTIWKAVVIT